MTKLRQLVREVHRRSLWQVLGVYAATSWIVLQVVETLSETVGLPEWFGPVAFGLLLLGLPIVLATAFVQEGIAPKEAESTAPAAGSASATAEPSSGSAAGPDGVAGGRSSAGPAGVAGLLTWRNALLGGLGAFSLLGLVTAVLWVTGVGRVTLGGAERDGDRISVAVLPFSSMGSSEQSEIFSLGIHDDLLTRLSKIGSLRVTSRTSVMEYRDGTASIPEIAEALGVSHVLEGSILSAGGQINLNAQLIDGATDEHLWAETYNRALTVSNVFAIQKELAAKITESLSATLLPEEAERIETPPTANLEAYNFFLRGHSYFADGPRHDDFDLAIQMYEKAVELDPGFAEAHARLGLALGMKYEVQPVGDPELLERALASAERAFQLDSELPQAHLAFAQYYYTGDRNLDLAMEHLARAGRESFHTADLFHLLGAVQRRRGDLDGAIASMEELVRLDPLSAHFHDDLGSTYGYAARWEDGERALRRSMELAPRGGTAYVWLALDRIKRGDLEGARAVLDGYPGEAAFAWNRWLIDLLARDFDAAAGRDVGHPLFPAMALDLKGDAAAARPLLDSARARYERTIAEDPDQALPQAGLGWVYAALGRREEAVRQADRAVGLMPVSRDFLDGPDMLWWKALTHARLGEVETAVTTLEELVRAQPPGAYPPAYMELHPGLDPLRGHPRFAALLVDDPPSEEDVAGASAGAVEEGGGGMP